MRPGNYTVQAVVTNVDFLPFAATVPVAIGPTPLAGIVRQ